MENGKKPPQYKEPPFMNIVRKKVFNKYPDANIVYGNMTTPKRKELGLEKTHYNDALVIANIERGYKDSTGIFKIKQFRKKKRSLHEANPRKGRKEPNRKTKRNKKNTICSNSFNLNDKVKLFGQTGWISGFCRGGAYVKNMYDEYITVPEKSYKQVSFKYLAFVCHNNNWQFTTFAN